MKCPCENKSEACNKTTGVCEMSGCRRPGVTIESGCTEGNYLTLRKIAIWLSKNCQKLDIFFKKIDKNCHFLAIFGQSNGNFPEGPVLTSTSSSIVIIAGYLTQICQMNIHLRIFKQHFTVHFGISIFKMSQNVYLIKLPEVFPVWW